MNYDINFTDVGEGEAVLMIHGLSLSSNSYKENVNVLIKNGYRVVLVDLPGHGMSKIPPNGFDYSVENIGDSIFSIIKKLDIKSFDIVGHSMGAILALYIAKKYSSSIRKIVVIDSPVFGPPHKLFLTYPFMGHFTEYFLGRFIIKKYISSMYYDSNKIDVERMEENIKSNSRKNFWLMLSKFFKEIFSPQFKEMINNYKSLNVETLILWGGNDKWLSLEVANKFNKSLPRSKLITFPNCGHNPHEEYSEESNIEILRFLTSRNSN